MSKLKFLIRRIGQSIVTLWAVATALFLLMRGMPGDPTSYIVSPDMDPETRARLIESYGLNDPLHVQYIRYMQNLITGDFGQSFHSGLPVTEVMWTYLPNTLILFLAAFFIGYAIALPLGVLTAWYRGSRFEKTTIVTSLMIRSVPAFWIAIIIIWIGGAELNLIPMQGMTSIGSEPNGFWQMVFSFDFLHHFIAPAFVLAISYMAYPLLLMRNSMLEVLGEDFIEVCRAKGLTDWDIMFRHGARNALLPILTAAAVALSGAIGGNVLIETVFGWPGLGREIVRAVLRRDYPVAQGAFIILAGVVIFFNLVADLLYGFLDPRVTYGEGEYK